MALGARRQDVRLQPRPDDVGGRVVPAVRAIRRVGPPRRDQRVQGVAADSEQHVKRHRLGERHARVVVQGERLAPAHPVRVDPAGRGRDQRVEVVRQALVLAPEQPGQPARVLVAVLSVRRAAAVATRVVTVVVPPAFHRRRRHCRRSETRNNVRPMVNGAAQNGDRIILCPGYDGILWAVFLCAFSNFALCPFYAYDENKYFENNKLSTCLVLFYFAITHYDKHTVDF